MIARRSFLLALLRPSSAPSAIVLAASLMPVRRSPANSRCLRW